MLDRGYANKPVIEQIEADIGQEAEEAVQFALGAPYPDASEVDAHVYVS
jgi:pyruvate dehydrogenase E1 component alpha subunit